ncbi:extracellular solute-binding protein [uncultured Tyzzerella sp.]|uniref:extracellular solute-binding protein n=1 Tax=uncultured Tyzzerella sp. TaxID=2321398 RepID=UPI002941FCF4|nr:extracellular solute-binding protein [uncultured Tyzzerella sp.]
MNPTGLPIVDKKGYYTFSLFVDNHTPVEGQILWQPLENQTNVKVNLNQYPYEIAKEKYGLALSSGDYTDAIAGWCLSQNDILKYGANMGVFIPLEKYFEKYAPNIMKVLELPGVRETMTAPDGHIYSIPFVEEQPKVIYNPFINQKWLDNLGLDVPANTEEFREVLRAFKEKDANGNGNPNDEIPFSADPNNRRLAYLCGWFGLPMETDGFTIINGELEFGFNKEEYKQFIEYMASLNAEGLLDPEFFTQDLSTWKAKGEQDLYGVSMAYGSLDFKKYAPDQDPEFVPLPVLSSPQCNDPKWLATSNGMQIYKNQFVITDKAKNPEIIVRYWDNVFETYNSFQALNGPFDKFCEKVGENHYRPYDTTKLPPEEQEKYSPMNIFPRPLPTYIPSDVKIDRDIELKSYKYEKKLADKLYAPYLLGNDGNGNYTVIPQFWVPEDKVEKLSEYSTSITSYVNQKTAAWISGQADVNLEWNEYCKQLEKLGLQEYINIKKEAIGKIQ